MTQDDEVLAEVLRRMVREGTVTLDFYSNGQTGVESACISGGCPCGDDDRVPTFVSDDEVAAIRRDIPGTHHVKWMPRYWQELTEG